MKQETQSARTGIPVLQGGEAVKVGTCVADVAL